MIVLEPWSPQWKSAFERECARLAPAFEKFSFRAEHIGSTSVEGLAGKPVIDMLIGLERYEDSEQLIAPLENAGYVYFKHFETRLPNRRFFARDENGVRTHNLHLVALDGEFWERHLLFRDYLCTHPETRDAYLALKKELAVKFAADTNAYADAKTPFIRAIEMKAAMEKQR